MPKIKRILSIIVCVMLCGAFYSCDTYDSINLSNSQTKSYTISTSQTKSETFERLEMMYQSILKNVTQLYSTEEERYIYFKDCKFPSSRSVVSEVNDISFAVIDLDNNGIVEVIISDDINGDGDKILLHCYEGIVYSYTFTFRNMYYLNNDGSFAWNQMSYTGHEYGSARLEFTGQIYELIILDKVVNDGQETTEFYINGLPVTQEQYSEYVKNQNTKK